MKKISFIKRLGISGNIFIIGLIIASFVLINTIDIASKIAKENHSNNKYSQSIQYRLSYNGKEKLSKEEYNNIVIKIIKCLESLECNASISGVGICVNNQIDDMFPEIVVNYKNDYKLMLNDSKSGVSDLRQYWFVVGESIVELTKGHLGDSLNVAGMQVPIQGVFKNNNAAAIDYSISFMYNECDREVKQYLTNQIREAFSSFSILVSLYSDSNIDSDKSKFITEMNNLSVNCQRHKQRYEGGDYQNYWYRFYNKFFLTICLIFSLFTCFSLSSLWLSSRKKEIAIRKAYGYNNKTIFKLLISDILKLTVPAIIISMAFEVLYCFIFDNLSFFDRYFVLKFLIVFLGSFLIGGLCAVNLMINVSKISPISAIREER